MIFYYIVSGNPNMIMFLAANKADLEEKRKVVVEVLGPIGNQMFPLLFHSIIVIICTEFAI